MLDIKTKEDVLQLIKDYKQVRPKYFSFDKETNGLNIKHHKPFLMSFGFPNKALSTIYTYTIDFELTNLQIITDTMYVVYKIEAEVDKIIGHNVSFDCHMRRNIKYPFKEWGKLTDTQFYIRLAHDAKIPKEGGPPLKLKEYTVRYIDPKAKHFEHKLKEEIATKKRRATMLLKEALKGHALPIDYTGTAKSWTMQVVEWFLKDKIHELKDLPSETAYIIRQWQKTTPDPENYQLLNRANVTEYAHYDVIYTLLIFLNLKEKVVERGQLETLRREELALKELYKMEEKGNHFDYQKAIESKEKMRNYIISLRNELTKIAGEPVKIGQSERIKELFLINFDLNFRNTEKETLELIFTMDNIPEEAIRMVQIIGELRSLEKWYSTYLVSWIEEVEQFGNIVYPTYHQVGTVTGRVSSAFQQFPRKGKYTIDGEYLFHPRELFIPPKGYKLLFFDYAAMEMRILANFTILLNKPDINLVRAFQPFKCYRLDFEVGRVEFDNNEPNWEYETWYRNEDGKIWEPTDIHSLTARNAFDIPEDQEVSKELRNHGKTTNFSIVYGATPKSIAKQQKVTMAQAQKLYNAYFISYPKVQEYNNYIKQHIDHYGFIQNLFSRKYYGVSPHKGKNYNIQGTGADYTKSLLPEIGDLLEGTPIYLQGYLHDEFSFAAPLDTPDEIVYKIQEIMEKLNTPITMKVDIEETTTTWKDKKTYVGKSI